MNHEPGHARSRLTTKLSPGSFAKSPLQANRLLETAAFTNPTSQILPLAKQPDQTISKLDRSISNPTKPPASQIGPSATRPNHQQARSVHQQPAQTISKLDQSISTTQRQKTVHRPKTVSQPKNCQPTREPSAGLKTASRPKNRQLAKKPPTSQRTISRPKNCLPDQTVSSTTQRQPKNRQPKAKELSTGQRTVSWPKNHQPTKLPYFRALPSLKALPTLAPRGR